jgi:hypothetical protein
MSEVEYVAIALAVAGENACHFGFDRLRRAEQGHRIAVSLKGHAMADAPTGIADVHRPVQAQCVITRFSQAFQPQTAPFGEGDPWHQSAIGSAGQGFGNPRQVGQRELMESGMRQAAAPAVEHHDRLSAAIWALR